MEKILLTMHEFAKRRETLAKKIAEDGIVILPAANEVFRNADSAYPFRQQSDFYYLTGFNEPEAILVLMPKKQGAEYILFNRPHNPAEEKWDGPRAGQEGACQHYLANQSFPYAEFETRLPDLLSGKSVIYYPIGCHADLDNLIMRCLNKLRSKVRNGVPVPAQLNDVLPFIHDMRLFKSPQEMAFIQQAIDITAAGHIHAMQACRPGMYEYELQAVLSYEFIRRGAFFHAYTPIVGAGENSCILHYIANNKKMAAEELVLIDAGAEYHYYAADITRTFPVNGRFTAEQQAIYELVLASQQAAIDTIKPGASWLAAQTAIVKVLTQGLIDLTILQGSLDEHLEKQSYLAFYMHRSGHWMGLDVHDAGCYRQNKEWRTLAPTMVLTVEPGLYFAESIPKLHKRWHHIGVRIEDDIVVTEKGCRVLSEAIPKSVADIEKVMQK